MTLSHSNSIALLIDADNAPAAKIEFILSELAAHGVVNIRRAYGNWTKSDLAGWIKVLHENSIQPMQSFDLVKGKNATDMALVIDTMDLLYTKKVNTFCLVSSDSDFTPLIQRLRADGKEVFGFGELKTPEPFIAACTRFIYLEEPKPAKSTPLKPKSEQPADAGARSGHDLKGNAKLIKTLRTAVLLFCSLLTSALCAPLPGDERSWTGVNGATFVGVFTRTFDEGGVKKVQFITPVGKIITVAFENLSEEDRGIILAFESKAHSKPAPAAASGEAFKELPNANRTRIPKFKPDDFGGTDEESLVDALWVSLLWWDTTGIMTIPKSGDIEKKAEWLHKELSRYISKGGRGAATLEEAREGVHEYFEKRLEDTGACKGRIVKNVDPGTLAALAAGNDIVILDMTMTYSNSRNFSVTGVIESMQADGAFVMHLFGESFSGKMSPTTEVKPMNPGAKAYEFTLNDRDKMPDHYKTQGARFFIGDNAWNGSLVLKPYVYKTPGKKAPIPE